METNFWYLAQSISLVRSTTGVSRLVKYGQEAARLSVNMLDQILSFTDDRRASLGGRSAHVNRLNKGAPFKSPRVHSRS